MNADVHGLPPLPTELLRTLTDASGPQPRGLQNRLRALEIRAPTARFLYVALGAVQEAC